MRVVINVSNDKKVVDTTAAVSKMETRLITLKNVRITLEQGSTNV